MLLLLGVIYGLHRSVSDFAEKHAWLDRRFKMENIATWNSSGGSTWLKCRRRRNSHSRQTHHPCKQKVIFWTPLLSGIQGRRTFLRCLTTGNRSCKPCGSSVWHWFLVDKDVAGRSLRSKFELAQPGSAFGVSGLGLLFFTRNPAFLAVTERWSFWQSYWVQWNSSSYLQSQEIGQRMSP